MDTEEVHISFLDEQYHEMLEKSNRSSEFGYKGAQKRWSSDSQPIVTPLKQDGTPTDTPIAKNGRIRNKDKDTDIHSIYTSEVKELFESVVVFFDEKIRPKTEAQKIAWLDTLDKCIRIDGYSPDQIHNIIKRMRMDDFWRTNFMSVMKLRQLNKEKVKYIDVFAAKVNARKQNPSKIQSVADVAHEVIEELTGSHE
jgi:hypothetical protein